MRYATKQLQDMLQMMSRSARMRDCLEEYRLGGIIVTVGTEWLVIIQKVPKDIVWCG